MELPHMHEYAHVEHFGKTPTCCESVICLHVSPLHDQHLQSSLVVHRPPSSGVMRRHEYGASSFNASFAHPYFKVPTIGVGEGAGVGSGVGLAVSLSFETLCNIKANVDTSIPKAARHNNPNTSPNAMTCLIFIIMQYKNRTIKNNLLR